MSGFFQKLFSMAADAYKKRQEKKAAKQQTCPRPTAPARQQTGKLTDIDRGRLYLDKLPPTVCGTASCENHTFRAACELVKEFALSVEDAFPLLREWADRGTHRWTDDRLMKKLRDAAASPGPVGGKRDAEYHRPMTAEDIELEPVVVIVPFGRQLVKIGPGGKHETVGYRDAPPKPEVDLSDLSNLHPAPSNTSPFEQPAPTRPAISFCPRCVKVLMRKEDDPYGRVMTFPCRAWHCPYCHAVRVSHCCDTVRFHLNDLAKDRAGRDTAGIYLYECPADQWDTVSRHIRANSGDFFRLDNTATAHAPGDNYLVLSTVRPVSLQAEELSPEAGRDRFCRAIENLSPTARGKLFSSSRRWKLLEDTTNDDAGYKRVCRITTSLEKCEEVLRERGIEVKYKKGLARWWGWRGIQFCTATVSWDQLQLELSEGSTLPDSVSWGKKKKPADEPDEWAPTPAADPPAPKTWQVEL